ncbi:MAG: hypothetical protein ACXWC9_08245 [Pseudobdellovibrionaceae bacterium]
MSFCRVILTFFISVLISSIAWAEDHPAPEDHSGGDKEAAAEGGKKGEKSGGAAEPKVVIAPWLEVENKIQELYSKIKSKEELVLHLLEEKDHLPNNSPQLQQTVRDIVLAHKELRRLVEDYQKNLSILKYRFPERNAKHERNYQRFEVKSIDDMEQALGIDGKLSRNMKKMRGQYGVEAVPEPASYKKPSPASVAPKNQSIEDAHSVILQK